MTGIHDLRNRLRAKLAAGKPVYGTFIKLPTVEAVSIAAGAGLDFIVIDREHSQLDAGQARALVAHGLAVGIPCLVRVPEVDGAEINRLLEAGAAGIQLSMTVAAQQVAELTAATRHAPAGKRSVSLTQVSAGFGAVSLTDYLQAEATQPPILVCQVETPTTDDPLDVLAEGLDVLFVGTTDLAVGVGLDHPQRSEIVDDVMVAVVRIAHARGIFAGAWGANVQGARTLAEAGFSYLVIGSDLQLLGAAARELGNELAAPPDNEES